MRRATVLRVAVIALGSVRTSGVQQATRPTFRAAVEYVEIDARVLDAAGNPIRDLSKERFQIFEDGV